MRLIFLAPFCLAFILVACGGSEEALPELTADEVLSRSVTAVGELRSFHFRLSHENGSTRIPLNLELESAEGDVVLPDRLAATIEADAGPISVSVNVISIGERTWITNPFTRRWQLLPGVSARDIADPGRLVVTLVKALREVRQGGQEKIDGRTAYRLTGVLDSAAIGQAFGSAESGFEVAIELWVDAADFLPRRARLTGRLSDGEPANIVRQIELSKFNASVDIRPPE